MKKTLFFLMGIALMAIGCQKAPEPVDGSLLMDYLPGSQTVEVVGTLTPSNESWITMSQTDNKVTFTVKLNMSGGVRTATFPFANSTAKYTVTQKTGTSDAKIDVTVTDYDGSKYTVNVGVTTSQPELYSGWGIVYGKATDGSDAKEVAGSGAVKVGGDNILTITPADKDQYYAWGYITSTEGDKILGTTMVPLVPAFRVKAGDDLQAIINKAPEYSEIRVAGGAVFNGPILLTEANKNKVISSGWNASFTEQSMDNLTVIDGNKENIGFLIAENDTPSAGPIHGNMEISYFEIRNCKNLAGGGSAVRVGVATVENYFLMHHCYVHDNEVKRGTIYTLDGWESFSGTYILVDNVIANNLAHGHAAAVEFLDGRDTDGTYIRTQGVMVGNLLANNVSDAHDGYAGSVMVQNKTDLLAVNNTVVNTFNWREDNEAIWQSFYFRGPAAGCLVNNIIVACWENCIKWTGGYRRYEKNAITFAGYKTAQYNIFEGEYGDQHPESGLIKDNTVMEPGFDVKTILKNPEINGDPATFAYNKLSDFIGGNYAPVGIALGPGIMPEDIVWYNYALPNKPEKWNHSNIKKILTEDYPLDINGKPFVKNGAPVIGALAE